MYIDHNFFSKQQDIQEKYEKGTLKFWLLEYQNVLQYISQKLPNVNKPLLSAMPLFKIHQEKNMLNLQLLIILTGMIFCLKIGSW